VSDSLVESELFGHVEGAFTGAERANPGKFRLAHGGTLFLDEISSMSSDFQGTILRALEEESFYPVGGSDEIQVDTRVVAASNRPVRQLDQFRDDLYYRLAEYVIEIPPLRDRKHDIPHLARRFMREASEDLGRDLVELSGEAVGVLREHDWPGNVRELRNVIRQAALAADDEIIRALDIDIDGCSTRQIEAAAAESADVDPAIEVDDEVSLTEIVQRQKAEIEQSVIRQVMEQTDGNMAETARKLNVDYKTIYRKVREYGIVEDD
ncbi:MAG: sigma 54-interacting transcriptional regulator, partial [Bradymonadaceae bacterium]